MVSFEAFAAELKAFDGRRAIINEIRKDLRKSLPPLRRAVRQRALTILPSENGLNAWVAKSTFSIRFRDTGRSAGIKVRVSRKNTKGKADLKRLDDAGRVRHPLHGNRKYWYTQTVPAGFFSDEWDGVQWEKIADDAMDRALDQIREG